MFEWDIETLAAKVRQLIANIWMLPLCLFKHRHSNILFFSIFIILDHVKYTIYCPKLIQTLACIQASAANLSTGFAIKYVWLYVPVSKLKRSWFCVTHHIQSRAFNQSTCLLFNFQNEIFICCKYYKFVYSGALLTSLWIKLVIFWKKLINKYLDTLFILHFLFFSTRLVKTIFKNAVSCF